jgi:hypothetical protein
MGVETMLLIEGRARKDKNRTKWWDDVIVER